ncbi:hypothetical protein BASA62_003876 [Batrachochytrium salamandrivorans]|nr:hypothetical protein BASA62_003876 [Batrachochytrium salamandrivorans]
MLILYELWFIQVLLMSSRGYDDGRRDRSPRRDVSYGRRDDNRDRPPPFGRDSPRSGGGGYRDDRGPPVAVTFGEMTVLDTVSIGAGTIAYERDDRRDDRAPPPPREGSDFRQRRRSVSPGAGGDRRPRRDDHRGDGGYPPSRGSDRGGGGRPNFGGGGGGGGGGSSGNSNPYETNVFELDPAFSAKFETEGSGINQPNRNRWPTPPIVHATHGGGAYPESHPDGPIPKSEIKLEKKYHEDVVKSEHRYNDSKPDRDQIFKGELAPKVFKEEYEEKTMLTGESGGSQSCDAYTEHIRIQEELRLKRLQNL